MTTSRQAYKLDASHPGSDLVGETAAAMAASSIAFKRTDPSYSATLLQHARELFSFANTYQGKYDDSIPNAQASYQSSGFQDEMLWAAIWLYKATAEDFFLQYLGNNAVSYGATGWTMREFSWDTKYAGVQVLASMILLQGAGSNALRQYVPGAEYYLCSLLQKNGGENVQRTPGGLLFTRPWNNMQYVTSASLLLALYSDRLASAGQQLKCTSGTAEAEELLRLAQSQVNYILGDNPKRMSYLVGYGSTYPLRVHHRGASIVSYELSKAVMTCQGGYAHWYARTGPNPNVLVGALVGGPDQNDQYADDRSLYQQSEPTLTGNAPLPALFARFAAVKANVKPSPVLESNDL